jgi:hypothetical protein
VTVGRRGGPEAALASSRGPARTEAERRSRELRAEAGRSCAAACSWVGGGAVAVACSARRRAARGLLLVGERRARRRSCVLLLLGKERRAPLEVRGGAAA